VPEGIHAGGLRYHGDSALVSQLRHEGLLEAQAYGQIAVFGSAMTFARTEGILRPRVVPRHPRGDPRGEARGRGGEAEDILFNLSGHGFFDLTAYDDYLNDA